MTSPVPRPHYEALLKEYRETPHIKVLSGVRRCGKSTLLEILRQNLQQEIPSQNILFLRCDSADVPLNSSAAWLDETVQNALEFSEPSYKTFFLLDEIQEITGWEKIVRRLHTEKRADVYLTGSNAFLLSSDLATYLSGRYVEIPVFPLSFREYLEFVNQQDNSVFVENEIFARYLRYGGMPGLFALRDWNTAAITRELQAIHDTVILNDVAKRFDIRDIDLLERLVRYVFSTSGNLFSVRKIVGALQSGGKKAYAETIDAYLHALQRAFLLYPCEQAGLQGKDILRPLRKLYAPDTGLRNLEIGFKRQDMGFQLESVVRMELERRSYRVAVGALKGGEIDFVASKEDEMLYLQVALSVVDEATLERELAPLRSVHDAHPKMVLTTDSLGLGTTPDGIQIFNVIDWLLESDL